MATPEAMPATTITTSSASAARVPIPAGESSVWSQVVMATNTPKPTKTNASTTRITGSAHTARTAPALAPRGAVTSPATTIGRHSCASRATAPATA